MSLDKTGTDENLEQQNSSERTTPPNKNRRMRKVNWTPSSEPETYRTVVINYSFAKSDKNQEQPTTVNESANMHGHSSSWRKPRELWRQKTAGIKAEASTEEHAEAVTECGSDLNLRKLYEESVIQLLECKSEECKLGECQIEEHKFEQLQLHDLVVDSKQDEKTLHEYSVEEKPIDCIDLTDDMAKEILKVIKKADSEVKLPKMETYPKDNLKPICQDCEVIVISDDEDEERANIILSNSKTTSTTSHNLKTSESTSTDMPEKMMPLDSMEKIEEKLKIKVIIPENQSTNTPSQKLKLKMQPTNTFKQRQLELHRHRIQVEQRRLELIELKMARERDEMIREQVLFEKELELKNSQLRQLNDDRI